MDVLLKGFLLMFSNSPKDIMRQSFWGGFPCISGVMFGKCNVWLPLVTIMLSDSKR